MDIIDRSIYESIVVDRCRGGASAATSLPSHCCQPTNYEFFASIGERAFQATARAHERAAEAAARAEQRAAEVAWMESQAKDIPCVYTGIDIPMCFAHGVPATASEAPTRSEPLCTTEATLYDEILQWESHRIRNPASTKNRIVYDSLDPNPERPEVHVTGTVPSLPSYYKSTGSSDSTLVFESRFEAGNLRRAVQVTEFEYDLVLNPDYNTKNYTQWFYFSISNARVGTEYRFNIINMVKSMSLYNDGMRPLMFNSNGANHWLRAGSKIAYYQNGIRRKDKGNYFTLTFTITFEHAGITYLAHAEPYTYSDLQDFLKNICNTEASQYCRYRRRKLCDTLAGNSCDVITITNFANQTQMKERRGVVFTARVHPGETSASWIMKGVIECLMSDTPVAKFLRDLYVIKIVPMLNPDGVIVGNYRSSLCGLDLNRQWQEPSRKLTPTIFFTKQMILRLCEEREVAVFIDIHGHSREKNIFMYGNTGPSMKEKIFPLLLSKTVDYFSYPGCSFEMKKDKESSARVVVYNEFSIARSYTLEASLCGASTGNLAEHHFNRTHLEKMGWHMCEALLDLCDVYKVALVERELMENISASCSDKESDKKIEATKTPRNQENRPERKRSLRSSRTQSKDTQRTQSKDVQEPEIPSSHEKDCRRSAKRVKGRRKETKDKPSGKKLSRSSCFRSSSDSDQLRNMLMPSFAPETLRIATQRIDGSKVQPSDANPMRMANCLSVLLTKSPQRIQHDKTAVLSQPIETVGTQGPYSLEDSNQSLKITSFSAIFPPLPLPHSGRHIVSSREKAQSVEALPVYGSREKQAFA